MPNVKVKKNKKKRFFFKKKMFRKVNCFEFNEIFKKNKVLKFNNFLILIEKNTKNDLKKKQKFGISFYKKTNFKNNKQKKIKRIIYGFLCNQNVKWNLNFIILIKTFSFKKNQKNILINTLISKKIINYIR